MEALPALKDAEEALSKYQSRQIFVVNCQSFQIHLNLVNWSLSKR